MAFRFNFGAPSSESGDQVETKETVPMIQAKRVFSSGQVDSQLRWETVVVPSEPAIRYQKCVLPPGSTSTGSKVLADIVNHSDVVPSVYEGGFKLWECAVDLLQFLQENKSSLRIRGGAVAELGCGHGLPALHCVLQGAAHVALQDLNEEVLHSVTVPNLVRNKAVSVPQLVAAASGGASQVSMFAGDWRCESLADIMGRGRYHLILTSDTLYSLQSIPHLLRLIDDLLAPGGVALVAAKRFYFGVGGSTATFLTAASAKPNLSAEVARVFEDGQSNIREVIKLTKAGTSS